MRGIKMKLKGFTLIEVIVVIAIIAILAAYLVPNMLGYVWRSRMSRMNSNARSVYEGAQLAITDKNCGKLGTIAPDCVYTGSSDCIGHPDINGVEDCSLRDYLGENFKGYFLFVTNSEGSGCVYALWSEYPIASSDSDQLTMEKVKELAQTSKPKGCHPLKASS